MPSSISTSNSNSGGSFFILFLLCVIFLCFNHVDCLAVPRKTSKASKQGAASETPAQGLRKGAKSNAVNELRFPHTEDSRVDMSVAQSLGSSEPTISLLLPEDEEFTRNFDHLQHEWEMKQEEMKRAKLQAARALAGGSPSPTPTVSPSAAPTLPPSTTIKPPNCINDESEVVFVHDLVSFEQTLQNCMANIPDALTIPVVINGSVAGVMDVGTNIQINNLHVVDAVSGSVTIDFYLRLYWRDNRFNMPLFWQKTSPYTRSNGYYLTKLLEMDELPIWLPDIRFHDASSIDVLAQTLRVNSSNVFFWSRHIVLELMQPKLQFEEYPTDEQTLLIRYGSYSFNQNLLKLYFVPSAISYNQNYDGSYTFLSNPLWVHDRDSAVADFYVSSSGFKNAIFELPVKRVSNGVMLRLVLPITILTILGGFTFWSDPGARFDSTVTLLLAVSALYIVILGNIPMLGYLTAIDKYCFVMFVLLAVAALMHQGYITLMGEGKVDDWDKKKVQDASELEKERLQIARREERRKQREAEGHSDVNHDEDDEDDNHEDDWEPEDLVDLYPLRLIMVRVLESFGKICILPLAIIALMVTVNDGFPTHAVVVIWICTILCMLVVGYKESFHMYDAILKCNESLCLKSHKVPSLITRGEKRYLSLMVKYFPKMLEHHESVHGIKDRYGHSGGKDHGGNGHSDGLAHGGTMALTHKGKKEHKKKATKKSNDSDQRRSFPTGNGSGSNDSSTRSERHGYDDLSDDMHSVNLSHDTTDIHNLPGDSNGIALFQATW